MKYKAGDVVKVREWEDMKRQYGLNGMGNIDIYPNFTEAMKLYCGKNYEVSKVLNKLYLLEHTDGWVFSDEMLASGRKEGKQ